MFSIEAKTTNGFDLLELRDNISGTSIEISPACGAVLHSFNVMQHGKPLNVIDNYGSRQEFETAMEAKGFKGAKLSPFVCRIKNGKYSFAGKDYRIQKFYLGENAIHGLIYDKTFSLTHQEADEQQASVELLYQYRGEDEGYPFFYDCRVRYELKENSSLTVTSSIINVDAGIIPVCDGWHPYFCFGNKIDDCLLEFQSLDLIEFDKGLIPTGNKIPYQEFRSLKKVGNIFFDNCFTVNFAECQPMLVFRDAAQNIQLEIRPDKSYPFLQIYTPDHRQSIAFENLSAAPDAFNNMMGLISLTPGENVHFSTNYTIRQS